MKNCKSIVNRFGFRISIGKRVGFRRVNDANVYTETVSAIDTRSEFAKAYGARISFENCGSTVTVDDCLAPSSCVPIHLRAVSFGPVSQVNIQARAVSAETRENPALCANECQAVANTYGLPVVFSCEVLSGRTCFSHTFFPQR